MPAANLTTEEREQAFMVKHVVWNRALVYLGPNAEMKALQYIVEDWLNDAHVDVEPTPKSEAFYAKVQQLAKAKQYGDAYQLLEEDEQLEDWELLCETRIAGDDE